MEVKSVQALYNDTNDEMIVYSRLVLYSCLYKENKIVIDLFTYRSDLAQTYKKSVNKKSSLFFFFVFHFFKTTDRRRSLRSVVGLKRDKNEVI